ncbi:MAG: hypothetical protein VXW43_07290 [Pseudomonadota bacterium]|nr:hypothetical protein [Pseudomonadota bacterium]
MTKPKKRPIIDRRRQSERQKKAEARIDEMRDKLAIDARAEELKTLNAMRDTFNDALWQCDDDRLIHDMFSLLCRVAKMSDARLIAGHPDCPEAVRDELNTRVEESRREKKDRSSKAESDSKADA